MMRTCLAVRLSEGVFDKCRQYLTKITIWKVKPFSMFFLSKKNFVTDAF